MNRIKIELNKKVPPFYLWLALIVVSIFTFIFVNFLSWQLNKIQAPIFYFTKHGDSSPTSVPNKDPLWLVYSDQDISFQYPKTFCGTSWQENWDSYSCQKNWEVERTQSSYSSSSYAGGKKDLSGKYIQILPSYSSFGFEFSGDIQIFFASKEDFEETTQGKVPETKITKNGYSFFVEEGTKGGLFVANKYYLSNAPDYLIVTNYFPGRYPRYFAFFLDSIKLK